MGGSWPQQDNSAGNQYYDIKKYRNYHPMTWVDLFKMNESF